MNYDNDTLHLRTGKCNKYDNYALHLCTGTMSTFLVLENVIRNLSFKYLNVGIE